MGKLQLGGKGAGRAGVVDGMRRTRGRAPALLLLLAAGAASVGSSGCTVFRRPEVTFRGVAVRSLDSGGAAVEAAFDVYNPNSYGIAVQRLTYRMTVEGREAGGGVVEEETALLPRETTLVRLPLTLDWTKLKSAGWEILTFGGIDYAVEGEITFSTPVGMFRRPYRHAGRYAPLLPR
ncbi:MAG: LEA type 2 family protein [Acidobacteriota bacterium]|nr:LEA type 2 family protein [Acidobacteriota bacterium]